MGQALSQGAPTLTEKNLPDQSGKVFIVTGGTSGVGTALAQILYSQNAKVYIAARSEEKASSVIEAIKTAFPNSQGSLEFLHLDLEDLTTIKKSANEFLSKENKLDVLFNNAGVMVPPQGSKTKQGFELQLGTNTLAPFLFTKFLTPVLQSTANNAPPGTVRVVWVSSSVAQSVSPKGGVEMGNLDYKVDKGAWPKYAVSKAGNILHAKEFAKRYSKDGITSLSLDPGNLRTGLQRHVPGWQLKLFNWLLHPPIYGAYTELFAGLSPDATQEKDVDKFIGPWGRFIDLRKDIAQSTKTKEEGGTGVALEFWNWSEEQVKPFL